MTKPDHQAALSATSTNDAALAKTFDLLSPPADFASDPFPVYAALQRHAPVKRMSDDSYILTRFDDLDRIYRDTSSFSSAKTEVFRPKYGADTPLYEHHTTSLVFNDPPLHTRVRSIMVGAMNPRAISAMEPALTGLIDSLLDTMADKAARGETVDLIEDFASAIPIEVIGNLLGIPHTDRHPLRGWSLAILGALEPKLTQAQHDIGNQAVRDFVAYLDGLVIDRKNNPGDPETDVLTRLITSGEEPLSTVELLQNCIFILNAGHETTTNLIGNGIWLLHEHPDQMERLKAQPTLINTAIDEFLRMESPNQFGNRLTTKEVELNGIKIPANTDLHLSIGAANRDPRKFANPDQLDIARKPNKHLAFAGGPHTCVGLTLARMEGRIAISHFLNRFPNFKLLNGAQLGGRIRFRGFAHLPAQLA